MTSAVEDFDPDDVRVALDLAPKHTGWLRRLASLGPPHESPALPDGGEARAVLTELDVPAEDTEEIVAALPDPDKQPELWWLLERTHHMLVADMGGFSPMDGGPTLPYELGATARYFYVYVYLSTMPAVRRFHAAHDIPDDVAWATHRDLGEKVAVHRRKYGVGGMDTQFWFTLHQRGVIYRLGRLQFNLARKERNQGGLYLDQPLLGTHVPELGGPMTPEACDASFEAARPFFDRHFPEHCARVAVCTSWLLDPQLAEYLPEKSNIVSFMRRWRIIDEVLEPADASMLEFVFRRDEQPLDELPRDTTLERAVVAHLKAGRHWRTPTGWLTLP
ncbi:MAG: DUF5596 domain-containing protein [Streptosporangiales bacterium]|nr:DUF5596 domain-containing protein [Streptosporangiales bacterium]MBO0889344.1 DUF5596 domain-containing protein [Acidothermales bacterium]